MNEVNVAIEVGKHQLEVAVGSVGELFATPSGTLCGPRKIAGGRPRGAAGAVRGHGRCRAVEPRAEGLPSAPERGRQKV